MVSRSGFSLVEVLIAGVVLAAVLIPLIGLMVSQKTDQQSEEGMGEAVTLAANLMETLLGSQVPFGAIDPGAGTRYVKGGPAGNVNQAGFRDVPGATALELEALLSDGDEVPPGGGEPHRFRNFRGKPYYICFFAGKYPDHPPIAVPEEPGSNRPDIENTLSFAYLEKPAPVSLPYSLPNPKRAVFQNQIVLDSGVVDIGDKPEALPYMQRAFAVSASPPEAIALPGNTPYFYKDRTKNLPAGKSNHKLMVGWPDVSGVPAIKLDLNDPASEQRREWSLHFRNVITRRSGQPTLAYHPSVIDQRVAGFGGGAYMKLVLGVRFAPYGFSHLRSKNDTLREFWIVSFKSNLEGS